MSKKNTKTKNKADHAALRIDLAQVPQDFLVVPKKGLANVELFERAAVIDGVVERGFAVVEQDGKTTRMSMKSLGEKFASVLGLTDASGSGVYAEMRYVRVANKLGAGSVVFEAVTDKTYRVSKAMEHFGPEEEDNRKDLVSRVSTSWDADQLFEGVLSDVGGHVILSSPGKRLSETALVGEGWATCLRFTTDDNMVIEDGSLAKAVACGDMLMVNAAFEDFVKKAKPLALSELAKDALSIKQPMVDAASKVLGADLEAFADAGKEARYGMYYDMKSKLDHDDETKAKVFGEFSKFATHTTARGIVSALSEHARSAKKKDKAVESKGKKPGK